MCTQQSYNSTAPNPTLIESTATNHPDSIRLTLPIGITLDVLHDSLNARKKHLYEQSAFCLVSRDIDTYLSLLEEVEAIDTILSDIYYTLNNTLEDSSNQHRPEVLRLTESKNDTRNEKKVALMNRLQEIHK